MARHKQKARLTDAQAMLLYSMRDGRIHMARQKKTVEILRFHRLAKGPAGSYRGTITPNGLDWLAERGWFDRG